MAAKSMFFILFALMVIVSCYAGIVPAAYVANYASSYNAHVVNHAIAAPVTAPLIAAPAAVAYASPYTTYPYSASLIL